MRAIAPKAQNSSAQGIRPGFVSPITILCPDRAKRPARGCDALAGLDQVLWCARYPGRWPWADECLRLWRGRQLAGLKLNSIDWHAPQPGEAGNLLLM